jgi:hypothetical protein
VINAAVRARLDDACGALVAFAQAKLVALEAEFPETVRARARGNSRCLRPFRACLSANPWAPPATPKPSSLTRPSNPRHLRGGATRRALWASGQCWCAGPRQNPPPLFRALWRRRGRRCKS